MVKLITISKKMYPLLHEMQRLGGFYTSEGIEYLNRHYDEIKRERVGWDTTRYFRVVEFNDDDKKVHMPETEINPPTPFL